jgi:hypothetical protein
MNPDDLGTSSGPDLEAGPGGGTDGGTGDMGNDMAPHPRGLYALDAPVRAPIVYGEQTRHFAFDPARY